MRPIKAGENAMQSTKAPTIYTVITDFLATNPSPEEIIAYQMPEAMAERAHKLLERNTEDEISAEEREELLDFLRFDEMMSLLKLKTLLKLKKAAE
jgi:hypothetical protein